MYRWYIYKNVDEVDYKPKYAIKLYRYGVLYDTLSVKKGSSVSLPSVATVQSTDTAHYGWTKTAGNTTRDYSATQSIDLLFKR